MDVVRLECLATRDDDSANIVEVVIPASATFENYVSLLSSTFAVQATGFYYRDDDGDSILVDSQRDIAPMLHYYRIQRSLGYTGLAIFPSVSQKKESFWPYCGSC